MAKRAAALADQFEQAITELGEAVEECPEDRWSTVGGPEGWTVAATAQHVAGQFALEREYIVAAAEGREMPAYTSDDINGMNDRRAAKFSACGKAEVLKLLREDGASMAAYVRGLSDEQLDRKSPLPLAGADVSTQQLIEGAVLIDHVKGHLASIGAAV